MAADRHQNGPLREQFRPLILPTIKNYWTRLARYRNLSVARRSAEAIIDLRENDKSRYFYLRLSTSIIVLHSITKLVLQWISSGSWAMSRFRARAIARRRKAWFLLRMSRILFASKHLSQTQLDGIAHEQTVICRQQEPLRHVVGSRPAMKRKKKLLQMRMLWIEIHQLWGSSVMHQSLTTTAQIVLFSKPTLYIAWWTPALNGRNVAINI